MRLEQQPVFRAIYANLCQVANTFGDRASTQSLRRAVQILLFAPLFIAPLLLTTSPSSKHAVVIFCLCAGGSTLMVAWALSGKVLRFFWWCLASLPFLIVATATLAAALPTFSIAFWLIAIVFETHWLSRSKSIVAAGAATAIAFASVLFPYAGIQDWSIFVPAILALVYGMTVLSRLNETDAPVVNTIVDSSSDGLKPELFFLSLDRQGKIVSLSTQALAILGDPDKDKQIKMLDLINVGDRVKFASMLSEASHSQSIQTVNVKVHCHVPEKRTPTQMNLHLAIQPTSCGFIVEHSPECEILVPTETCDPSGAALASGVIQAHKQIKQVLRSAQQLDAAASPTSAQLQEVKNRSEMALCMIEGFASDSCPSDELDCNEPFDAAEIVADAIGVLSECAQRKQLLLINRTPKLSGEFIGNSHLFRQAVVGLLGNAIARTQPHDSIEIECKINSDRLDLWVRDNALTEMGELQINEDALHEPQGSPIQANSQDRFLSQSMVKKLARRANGNFAVTITPNVGTSMHLSLTRSRPITDLYQTNNPTEQGDYVHDKPLRIA